MYQNLHQSEKYTLHMDIITIIDRTKFCYIELKISKGSRHMKNVNIFMRYFSIESKNQNKSKNWYTKISIETY